VYYFLSHQIFKHITFSWVVIVISSFIVLEYITPSTLN
jgi:hypothetical protein